VRRLAVVSALGLLLAGCGGGVRHPKPPAMAILTRVQVRGDSLSFVFRSPPQQIKTQYSSGPVAECGSGAPVRLPGRAALLVHFLPARTSGVERRLRAAGGPVLELAKVCDFEADVGWAVAVDRQRPFHVSRQGSTVTVSFD
jgi:hypothetical protein